MKIYELAKEVNVSSGDIVNFLKENDFNIKNHMAPATNEMIKLVKANYVIGKEDAVIKEMENKPEVKVEIKPRKTDADYKPDEMIPCRSVFSGTLLFSGDHTGMTYTFHGAGDRRNIEYQDLKAAMLQHKGAIYIPDIIIEDENLINDEHWADVKEVYENMYDEKDIQKIFELRTSDFKTAFEQLPITAKNTIITMIATQIEEGTFESYNKAKIVDEICGTRFDLKM